MLESINKFERVKWRRSVKKNSSKIRQKLITEWQIKVKKISRRTKEEYRKSLVRNTKILSNQWKTQTKDTLTRISTTILFISHRRAINQSHKI